MPNKNYVEIEGHLGGDPELKKISDDRSVCNFNVATSNNYKKGGEWIERPATWHRVVLYGDLGKVVVQKFQKGDAIGVRGKIQSREYEKDGVKKSITEIIAKDIYMPIWVKAVKEKTGEDQFILDISEAVGEEPDADLPF